MLYQFTSCLHFSFNRITDNNKISEPELRSFQSKLNNIDLIGSWLFQCAVKEAKQMFASFDGRKIVFGSKKNYIKRTKNEITNEEWKKIRTRAIYSIGEANQKGNRLFKLQPDLETVIFQPRQGTKIKLKLEGIGNRLKHIKQIYDLSILKQIGITYKLDQDYIYISYDEIPKEEKYSPLKNRVFALDLNPNYIGWSVVDWKSSSEYKIVDKGIIDFSSYNKFYSTNKLKSTDEKKKHINRKKKHETIQSIYNLINKAKHYKCQLFVIEDLSIESKDKEKGKDFNRMTNNTWHRGIIVEYITKLCNIENITLLKVKCEYTSLVGNIIFRDTKLPDMIVASIEIGRRGYEFYNQYITEQKEIRKNIVFPDKSDFLMTITSSLEELGLRFEDYSNLKKALDFINKKKSKIMYRLPLTSDVKVFKLKSNNFWTKILVV